MESSSCIDRSLPCPALSFRSTAPAQPGLWIIFVGFDSQKLRGSHQSQSPRLPTKVKNVKGMAAGMAARGPFSPSGPAEEADDADHDTLSFRNLMESVDQLRWHSSVGSIEMGGDPELKEKLELLR
jgi:hypothetical protein